MNTKPNKTTMRRLGFMPQQKPLYNVVYSVFPERLDCQTTCPNCLTIINFFIHGQTKMWSEAYIAKAVARALDRNHTAKCRARLSEYNDVVNRKMFIGDLLRGNEQRQERADRVLRGREAPQIKIC